MDLCTRHCCLKGDCDLAFMIRDSCYLVKCGNEMLCKTKKARPSNMNPRISFVTRLEPIKFQPQTPANGDAYSKWSTPSPTSTESFNAPPICHHTEVSYNVTLVGGINAGKFSTYGSTKTIDQCIRHCCHDDKCDVAFMIQGNCYAVECADIEGCQVKRAKPSAYNPTVAYVYRGSGRPVGDPLPGAEKPNLDSCSQYTVSNTVYNVTLSGGIKAGNFTDKGVVKSMGECTAFCCSDERCNVAFLIRNNCFTVACKNYDSCKMKPALSEYYHPRLAYVNWSPPDDEIPENRWYASLGCWKDTESSAVSPLEGSDPLLKDSYITREKAIDTCAQVSRKHDFKVFAIQNGGACLGGPTAARMFNQFGESSTCKNGTGGLFVNDVYRLTDSGSYVSLGCWNDSIEHSLPLLEHSDPILEDSYQSRPNPLLKCGQVARRKGFVVFAIQRGGMCFGGPRAEIDYRKYGISRKCRDGLGGTYANNVYRLIDNLEVKPTGSTDNITATTAGTPTPNSDSSGNTSPTASSTPNTTPTESSTANTTPTGSSTPNTTPTGSLTSAVPSDVVGTQRSPTISPSPTAHIEENYLTLQNDMPHKNTYTAGEILSNVTLKYGIKAGRFSDKGKVANMTECIRACGKLETCSLAFMLGKQCFAVSCYSDTLCVTKPAFSPFYKPKISYVKHKKEPITAETTNPSSDFSQCRTSIVHNDVTLVGGIHAGKFTDLGDAENMGACSERCCLKDACDVAFMLEEECYGVSCVNESMCEMRPARNPSRYNPKLAYVHHEKAKDTVSTQQKSPVCWDGQILYNYTLVGGINAGTFSDNGKTNNMDLCMQYCCNRESCDLAFMIEDDCYSVACNSNGVCEPRKARPTHYNPRIAIRKKPQGDYHIKGFSTEPVSSTEPTSSTPTASPSSVSSETPSASSPTTASSDSQPDQDSSTNAPSIKVTHSCDATPIEYNVTLKMGLHSGVFQKIGKVDSMDDCIEMGCTHRNSDVAFMLGTMCFAVSCYSDDLCKTVPIFGSSISRLNLNPAISFLKKKAHLGSNSFALQSEIADHDKCRDSTITYNVTLRGGIDAGNFTERPGVLSMRDCIGRCCNDKTCDLAFMFGDSCYSVECKNEKLCQAVLAKPTHLEPKVSYVTRGYLEDKDKGTMFSADDQTPTCRADQKSRSKVVSNKTLVGGLEAGKFSFVGVVRDMGMCMDRCCAQRDCNVAYMVDKNCFSVACYSPVLCKISDVSATNGDVEISTILNSTAEKPAEKHSMIVYVIIGVVGFAAGAGGILWAVCMFVRR
ncbi:PREDICTED: uncharacterized protein LOC107343965 [Acropora digitifera]|uniref:uncharacterized protein LOC107343965 n=1 Tax=Acropora digitifera TaxID=70779 RepID=UPI00077A632F|nr:PREDICTED: uncharacterized protein LOC107343965 [Acropora digitifera]